MVSAEPQSFDYIVIGAGSGGLGSGRRAALLGKKVAMIENKVIGGTCVNVGCVPKKVMFNLANFLEEAHLMKDYGVEGTEGLKLDFAHFKKQRDGYVKRLNGIYETNVAKSGVSYFTGTAAFKDAKTIETSEGAILTAPHILIAAGSKPAAAPFEGAEFCIDSDGVFEMEELPKSIVVLGGGYIGVEMAQIMAAFGVKTTLLCRSKFLSHVDQELIEVLLDSMNKLGLDARTKSPFTGVSKLDNGLLRVALADGGHVDAEKVLVALGRPPNVEPLKLDNAGVKIDKSGLVIVDEFQNTNVEGIYAIGDIALGTPQLTPVAIRAGRILSERLFNNRTDLKMCYDNIATVIFSHPTIGVVGLTEEQAKAKFGDDKVKVHRSKFTNMFFSPALTQEKKHQSLFKIICHEEKEGVQKVVGCHCIGKGVDEMMQGISIAITMGATKQDFDNSVAIHPTASEEFVLMDAHYLQ